MIDYNYVKITKENFKIIMIEKAKAAGHIWENFGQNELRKLKNEIGYNPYGTEIERKKAEEIDILDHWASHFDLSQL